MKLATTRSGERPRLADLVVEELEQLLGPHTARRALELVTKRIGGSVETLVLEDAADVCEVLTPMLRTLLGKRSAGIVVDNIMARSGETPT